MSRIDQALKRAQEGVVSDSEPTVTAPQRESFSLEEYPRERPSGSETDRAPARSDGFRAEPVVRAPGNVQRAVEEKAAGNEGTGIRAAPAPPERESTLTAAPGKISVPEPAASKPAPAPALTPSAGLVRQCQRIAGVLRARQAKDGLKTLAIMSAVSNEGKSVTAVTLALTISRASAGRVLLIDCNLRHPALHGLLGVPNSGGLTDALRSDAREIHPTVVSPLLHLLPAGGGSEETVKSAPELLPDRVKQLVDQCADRYDWVLLDLPGMSLSNQAVVLGQRTDAVVFVVGGSTSFPVVQEGIAMVGRPRIVATVLSGLEEASPGG